MIDANQNHLKDNPFISYPSVPCNTPYDAPFSSTLQTFFSPVPDGSPISAVLPQPSNCALVPPDCPFKGPVGLSGNSASSSQLSNGLIDGQYPQKGMNQPLELSLGGSHNRKIYTDPLSNLFNPKRPHLPQTPYPLCNGLSNSLLPPFQSQLFCKSETMPLIVQNGGVMALCPPPPSSKSGRAQRRLKVKV